LLECARVYVNVDSDKEEIAAAGASLVSARIVSQLSMVEEALIC
jgi:hypothetical protein